MNFKSNLKKLIYPYEIILNNIPNNAKIIDIGCGDGHLYNDIDKNKIISYTGIDPKIKKNIKSEKFKIINDNINNITEQVNKYNCIIMIDVMHHLEKDNQENIFKKIIYNMSSETVFIYKDISNRNFFYSNINKLHDLIYNFDFINYYSAENIINVLNNNKSLKYKHFFKRIFWYDHEFFIINN